MSYPPLEMPDGYPDLQALSHAAFRGAYLAVTEEFMRRRAQRRVMLAGAVVAYALWAWVVPAGVQGGGYLADVAADAVLQVADDVADRLTFRSTYVQPNQR